MYPPHHTSPAVVEPWAAPSAAPPPPPANEPIPEIFIGRVPANVSKETLEAHFAPYGAINFRLLEGRGCAFCAFSSWAAAETAMQALNGLKLDGGFGEGINVKFADVKGAPKGKVQQHPKVFIGNIGVQATEDVVREVCQQFGVVTNAKIFARTADSKPCAFVTFTSFGEAELCISALNGVEHGMAAEGKVLNVRLADAVSRKTPTNSSPGANHAAQLAMPMGSPAAPGVPLPFSPPGSQLGLPAGGAAAGRPGTSGGTGPKVFIGGLPEAATEEFVWGMMAPFGEVTEAKIHRKPGAKPCGFARFSQESEAQNAIAMLAENGRYAVRQADDIKPGVKRSAFPAPTTAEDWAGGGMEEMFPGAGVRAVRRLQ